MGENGAGKSTLIKALTGVYTHRRRHDHSSTGEQRAFSTPGAGAGRRHQHGVPGGQPAARTSRSRRTCCSAASPAASARIDVRAMNRRAARRCWRGSASTSTPRSVLGEHPIAVQQLVAIARAVDVDAAGADPRRADLEPRRRRGREAVRGHAHAARRRASRSLFVSHFLDQVYEISDRMTVLRNGQLVGEYLTARHSPSSSWSSDDRPRARGRSRSSTARPPTTDADETGTAGPHGRSALGRKGSLAAVDLELYDGRGGRPGRTARLRPHRARPAAVRRRHAPTPASVAHPLRAPQAAQPAARDRPQASPSPRRTARPRASSATSPSRDNIVLALQARRGWLRPIPPAHPDELVAEYIEALDIRPGRPGRADAQPLRRQPAEGAAGPLADHRARAADPRRADPRHRHRRQGPDPAARRRARRATACPWCSSPPSSRRCCGSADRIVVMRDRRKIAELANDDVTRRATSCEIIAGGGDRGPSRGVAMRSGRSRHRLLWPVLALVVAAACVNVVVTPDFFSTSACRTATSTAASIDILRNGAPIAAGRARHDAGHRHPRHRPLGRRGGGDRRRGRLRLHRRQPPTRRRSAPRVVGVRDRRSRSALVLGALERVPGLRPRHPADHRDAGADDRRPRHRAADHRRPDHHRQQRRLQRPRRRLPARPAGRDPDRARGVRR